MATRSLAKPLPKKSSRADKRKVSHVRLSSLRTPEENDKLYKPIDLGDPAIIALSVSVKEHGILEPLVVTLDGDILSGNRRAAAAKLAGLKAVPCRRVRISREKHPEKFVRLLQAYNDQREKTRAEKLREEVIKRNPEDAIGALYEYRREQAAVGLDYFEIEGVKTRKAISAAKIPFLNAIIAIINERRKFWPLSDRQIHYGLLNNPPLIHASKRTSKYKNNRASYQALTDLVTRARIEGKIPYAAIADETRPVSTWLTFAEPAPYLAAEVKKLLKGYYRDLMQSQPNHIEIVVEKNTVAGIVRQIASEYTIPMTSGRGYCSLPPRHAIAQRYRKSGKEKLILLLVSDFDPEGQDIAHSLARSLRDDFGVEATRAVNVALTSEQIEKFDLPPMMKAKESSSRYKGFIDKHGDDVFELEALQPEELQQIVREAIEATIDRDAYSAEIEAEAQDAGFLDGVRGKLLDALKDIEE